MQAKEAENTPEVVIERLERFWPIKATYKGQSDTLHCFEFGFDYHGQFCGGSLKVSQEAMDLQTPDSFRRGVDRIALQCFHDAVIWDLDRNGIEEPVPVKGEEELWALTQPI